MKIQKKIQRKLKKSVPLWRYGQYFENHVINIPETVRRQLRGKPDWLGLETVLSFSSGPSNNNCSLIKRINKSLITVDVSLVKCVSSISFETLSGKELPIKNEKRKRIFLN